MSEKKEVKPVEKTGFMAKVKALPSTIANAFKNMAAELKKVAWPTKKDLINYSLVVIAFVVVLAIVVGVLDTASSWIVRMLININL